MRKKTVLFSAVAVLGTVGVIVYPVATAGASDRGQVIRLTEKSVQFTPLDLGATGPSQGDEFVFASNLLDSHGHRVGTDGGYCVIVRTGNAGVAQCTATLIIRGDQLTGGGLIPLSVLQNGGRFTNAITGGTGRFVGAGGVLFGNQVSQTTALFTIRLTG